MPEITHLIHEARENCLAHIREEIGHAKDAAAGAVLTAAFFGVSVGVAMVLAWYFQRG